MHLRYSPYLFACLLTVLLCHASCTEEVDPKISTVHFGMGQGVWKIRKYTRGEENLRDKTKDMEFTFDDVDQSIAVDWQERDDSVTIILGDYEAVEERDQVWLVLDFVPTSPCDDLDGMWQALSVTPDKADFARYVPATGEVERLQFRQ